MTDKITVLETVGPCLTKIYKSDGTTDAYDDAASFKHKVVEVASLRELSELLGKLHKNKKRCLIAGAPKAEMQPGNVPGTVVRNNANFDDQPLHSFVIDIDGYRPGFADPVLETEQAVLDFLEEKLPPCFKTASFYWHLSSSAGMPGKEGVLKCHLWMWSKAAYTTAQMYEWAKAYSPAIDKAVYRRVQIRYVADPIFEEGRIDPVPVRSGWHQGETDYVDLVLDETVLTSAREQGAGEGGNDMKLVDPSEKTGLIGLFNRVYSAEDVLLTHLEGEFEQATERRYTWLNGGGTPEGVWVHDDGMHVGSSHNTWPIDGIANLWDVVRVFKFGDLDSQAPEDFETLDEHRVGSRPSDAAMRAWAAGLPELQEQVAAHVSTLDEHRARITSAENPYALEMIVAPLVRDDTTLTASEREILAQTYNARLAAIAVKLPIATVRGLLRQSSPRQLNGAPPWAADWVWVADDDGFMNTETKEIWSERSFNALYDREMAPFADADGNIPRASSMALDVWGRPVVSRRMYAPAFPVTFPLEGIEYANTYRGDIGAAMPKEYSKADLAAIETLENHAKLLLPNDEERTLFLDYLAYCVQAPGQKIRWAPVLKGVEGDGKSAFIIMMTHILGRQNVRVLDSSTLEKSDFTAWRAGQCFTGVEEMKLHGHNRYDVFNKLKTGLTNDFVEIHQKGKDPFTVPNTTNYLLLTNFDDGVPINDNDRRCMILRTPFLKKEELDAKLNGHAKAYFDNLFDVAIAKHAGALRRWLIERKLSPRFQPNGRAPETAAREMAVDMSRRDDDDAIATILEDGGRGIYPNLVVLSCLNDALYNGYGIRLQTGRAKAVLATYGFTMWSDKQVKWQGKNYRFYYRGERPEHVAALASRLEEERLAREIDNDFAD